MFEFIHIVTLQAMFECQKDGKLPPYLGSTIRGIMGHCIRDFYCDCPAVKCFQCNKKNECFYVQYFSNTGGEAGAINPYTLYVHGNGKTNWKKGDICIFELTIFGKAAEQVYIYFDALKAMEDKGWGSERLPFRLIQVMDAVSETDLCGRCTSQQKLDTNFKYYLSINLISVQYGASFATFLSG